MKKLLTAACAACICIGGGVGAYAYYQTPQAYVSLDINPSVELGVNAFDTVVTAEAYNEDGEIILETADVTGGTVEEAVQSLVDSAYENGYIEEDGSTVISLTSETDDEALAEKLAEESESGVNEALEAAGEEAEVEKDNVALERRDEARELGITPGKLNLINKLQALDPDAKTEDYQDKSVKYIMTAIYNCKSHGNSGNMKNIEEAEDSENIGNQDSMAAEGTDAETAEETGTVDETEEESTVTDAQENGNKNKTINENTAGKPLKNKGIEAESNLDNGIAASSTGKGNRNKNK